MKYIVVTKIKMLISLIFRVIYKDMAKWDSGEGEEGGDEEVKEEDELGKKSILIMIIITVIYTLVIKKLPNMKI